jgi:hypothetical protein
LSNSRIPQTYIQRAPIGEFEYQKGFVKPNYTTDGVAAASVMVANGTFPNVEAPLSGPKGLVFAQGLVNPNVEFECPFYSPFRFEPGKTENHTGLALFNESWDYRVFTNGSTDTALDAFCAAGEDFQVYFFTGLPVMYYEPTPPTP